MSERRIYLDEGVGESRGVVTLDGAPERLLIRRVGDEARLQIGARLAAVAASVDPSLGAAFLDLGGGTQAVLNFKPEAKPVRGQVLEVEIRSEPRRGKLAAARLLGASEGRPRLLADAPPLADLLATFARDAELVRGAEARERADEAEAEALETLHPLPGGGTLAIEPTRALTALDVDLGERKGESKRVARQANLTAIGVAARLLRLKSLGGLVVMDLVGRGHDPAALVAAARTAFAADNPGVAIGGIGRFGALELSLPRRTRPLGEILLGDDGRLSPLSLALRLARRIEAEAQAHPGARILALCATEVAEQARALLPALTSRFGGRIELRGDPSRARQSLEVSAA